MAQPQIFPQAERTRKLQALRFQPNQILSRDLPRDTVLKSIDLRLSGSVVVAYSAGTPVSDAQSTFDNLIPRIDVIVNGSRTVKSVRPHLMRLQQLLYSKILGERKSSVAASAAPGNLPTVDGGFVYGTTGQVTTVAETITVAFECLPAAPMLGRESTWLNLKGVASAELRLTTAAFDKLLAEGTAGVTGLAFSADTFLIDVTTREAQDVDPRLIFPDWKQTTKSVTFTGEGQDQAIDINRGNKIVGLWLFVQNGDAARTPSNLALSKLNLKVNGQTDIKTTTFLDQQAQNKNRAGINAPSVANKSIFDGACYISLLAREDLSTALDVSSPLVDSIQLNVDTTSLATYTKPVQVTVMTEELVILPS